MTLTRPTRTFTKKGDKVLFKMNYPVEELNSKDIIEAIDNDQSQLKKQEEGIITLEKGIDSAKKNIEITGENIKAIEENLHKLKKFEEWALTVQESKLKAVVKQVKDECEKKVRDTYEKDDGLTADQNSIQEFHQYRQFIATHKEMAENIAPKVYKDRLYKAGFLDNPFIKEE